MYIWRFKPSLISHEQGHPDSRSAEVGAQPRRHVSDGNQALTTSYRPSRATVVGVELPTPGRRGGACERGLGLWYSSTPFVRGCAATIGIGMLEAVSILR